MHMDIENTFAILNNFVCIHFWVLMIKSMLCVCIFQVFQAEKLEAGATKRHQLSHLHRCSFNSTGCWFSTQNEVILPNALLISLCCSQGFLKTKGTMQRKAGRTELFPVLQLTPLENPSQAVMGKLSVLFTLCDTSLSSQGVPTYLQAI